jgi:hypothetical protein
MIVQIIDPEGELVEERPQDALPRMGERFPVRERDGSLRECRVGEIVWPEAWRGHQWYGPTDAARMVVRVYLTEEEMV